MYKNIQIYPKILQALTQPHLVNRDKPSNCFTLKMGIIFLTILSQTSLQIALHFENGNNVVMLLSQKLLEKPKTVLAKINKGSHWL